MATKKKKAVKYKKHNHIYLPMIHLGKNKLTPELYKKVQEVKKRHERIAKQQKKKVEKTRKLVKKAKKPKKPSPKPKTPAAPRISRRPRKRTSSPKPKKKTNSFEKKVKQNLAHKKRVRERREASLKRVQQLPRSRPIKTGNMAPPPARNVQHKRKRENWNQVNQQKHEANLGYMPPPLYRPGSSKDLNFYEFKDKGYMCGWKPGVSGCSAKECNFCVQGFNLQNYKDQIAKLYTARQKLKKFLYKYETGEKGSKHNVPQSNSIRKQENELFMEFAKARREIYNKLPCYWNNCFEKYPQKFSKDSDNRTKVIQMTPNTLREMKGTIYFPKGTEPSTKPKIQKVKKTQRGPGINNASPIGKNGLTPEARLQKKVANGVKLTSQEQKNYNTMSKTFQKV